MNKITISRNVLELDATDQSIGRLASKIAPLLIGKHKPDYLPNIDNGDIVKVSNASKMKITGSKMDQKNYYSHSGYRQGLRTRSMKEVWENNPGEVLSRAVSRMLPKNKLREPRMLRLHITN